MARTHSRRKEFSQNFLHDRRLIRRLVSQAGIAPDDLVVEIGPGSGALTSELLRQARQVLAVEVDPNLVERLQSRFANERGLILFGGDFLAFPLPHSPYKVFASLPYRHTAAIVGKLTSGIAPPTEMFLVMQLEAAQRFMGTPVGTLLGAELAPWFEMEIVHHFRRTDFRPVPAVDSVMLRIHRREEDLVPLDQRERYLSLVAATFSAWRPTVKDALTQLLPARTARPTIAELGSLGRARPSEVPAACWLALHRILCQYASAADWAALETASHRLHQQQETLDRPTQTRRRTQGRQQTS